MNARVRCIEITLEDRDLVGGELPSMTMLRAAARDLIERVRVENIPIRDVVEVHVYHPDYILPRTMFLQCSS